VFCGHASQESASRIDEVPSGHVEHAVKPSELANVPVWHATQDEKPDDEAYVPLLQAEHVSSGAAGTELYVPEEQEIHRTVSLPVAKDPVAHGMQSDERR
jgi:hypothetical protein